MPPAQCGEDECGHGGPRTTSKALHPAADHVPYTTHHKLQAPPIPQSKRKRFAHASRRLEAASLRQCSSCAVSPGISGTGWDVDVAQFDRRRAPRTLTPLNLARSCNEIAVVAYEWCEKRTGLRWLDGIDMRLGTGPPQRANGSTTTWHPTEPRTAFRRAMGGWGLRGATGIGNRTEVRSQRSGRSLSKWASTPTGGERATSKFQADRACSEPGVELVPRRGGVACRLE
ncbi:hypothetical protein K466DRAFT_373056 [Polyporus arcularius HHB13444]|uniref:Uncharacterized protein n=1 Tax=Polyporus arcularius HHB13444 TaxID=1314778 RepID=A0A5C3NU89_9APHY|nr:hypothetical protein K466DRAFT_373056 [Polyporus arcularius HHB13444]